MPGRNSIVVRLAVVTTVCSALIFAATLGYNYTRSRTLLEQELESNARNLALSLVYRVESELARVATLVEGTARSLESGSFSEPELLALIGATVDRTPEVFGFGVAFEPYSFNPAVRLYAPYYQRENGKLAAGRVEKSYRHLPYVYWDWYQIPRELGRLEWSEPYFDEGAGNAPMTSCSTPFYGDVDGQRQLRGVVNADVSLDALTDLVASVKVLKTGYAALLTRNGMVLAHPLKDVVMNETFFSIAEARGDSAMRELGKKMIRGESGFILYESLAGVRSWMYYAPIRSTGWTLTVLFPEAELLENVTRLSVTMAAMGGVGIVLLIAAVVYITLSITRPLRQLAAATNEIAAGNFDVALPAAHSRDEAGMLAQNFDAMRKSLKDYIRNLTETTAAKERIQGELKVATDIQNSLLPRLFPPFPDRSEVDIFASMDSAKEMSGDFYDFFFIDERHLCFLIADVADKGVPAALYMMVAKTLLKSEVQRFGDPAQALASVNNTLAADNDTCMFATAFVAILDTFSGEVRYANAGHNPPLLIDADGVRYLDVKSGFVLGPMPDSTYETEHAVLRPGDTFFLYTDGVTEAKNPVEALYGEQRLAAALRQVAAEETARMVAHVRAEVMRHAAGAPQSDDITLVAVTYRGGADSYGLQPKE